MLRELDNYLGRAANPIGGHAPTRCEPWTVRDVTAHLAATFARFNAMLAQGRSGDMTRPFAPEDLGDENLRAVAAFRGDPIPALRREATAFCDALDDDEMIPHQRGPVSVVLQLRWALTELAIHHDDIAVALGRSYRPSDEVAAQMIDGFSALDRGTPEPGEDVWAWLVRASGR